MRFRSVIEPPEKIQGLEVPRHVLGVDGATRTATRERRIEEALAELRG